MKNNVLALILALCIFVPAVFAAPASSVKGGNNVPTNIKSARMEYNSAKQQVIFLGNVHVVRPDFQLWSEKLTVYMKKNANSSADNNIDSMRAGDIDRIVAEKNVIIKSEAKEARAQTATYTINTAVFKLEGSPVLTEKDNTIKGKIIYHYMNEDRSEVVGAVEANFLAPDKTEKKK